jgi:hypothetical protein
MSNPGREGCVESLTLDVILPEKCLQVFTMLVRSWVYLRDRRILRSKHLCPCFNGWKSQGILKNQCQPVELQVHYRWAFLKSCRFLVENPCLQTTTPMTRPRPSAAAATGPPSSLPFSVSCASTICGLTWRGFNDAWEDHLSVEVTSNYMI